MSPFYGGAADEGRNVPLLLSYCLSILYLHSKGVLQMKAALYRKMEAQAIHRRWGGCPHSVRTLSGQAELAVLKQVDKV